MGVEGGFVYSDEDLSEEDIETTHVDITLSERNIFFPVEFLDSEAARSFKRGILILSNESVRHALRNDYELIRSSISPLPPVPDFFSNALHACEPLLKDPYAWPAPPSRVDETADNRDIYDWMYAAMCHMCKHWQVLKKHHPTHAEGWYDVNFWSVLLDHVFLKSAIISCDRKELGAGIPKLFYKHDGIIWGQNRTLVGLIEAKPFRPGKPEKLDSGDSIDFVRDDLTKVAYTLTQLLKMKKHPDLVLTGIICTGFDITILRGQWFGKVCLFKEYKQTVSMATLPEVLKLCWQLKLGFEHASCLSQKHTFLSSSSDI